MQTRLYKLMLSVALSLVFVCCVTAVGQVLKGSISGTITDPQGAVVANAQVKATNVATGAELQSTTDNTCAFRFNLIPTGTYKVDVSAPNFKTLSQTGILVNAVQDTGLGLLNVSVGEMGTTVQVKSQKPLNEYYPTHDSNTI